MSMIVRSCAARSRPRTEPRSRLALAAGAERRAPRVARDEIVGAAALVGVESLGDGGREPAGELEREAEALARILGQADREHAIDVAGQLREQRWPGRHAVDDLVQGRR